MLSLNTQILTILGKVDEGVLYKLQRDSNYSINEGWFFIDYSLSAISLDTQFEYTTGTETYFITITECIDPFGRNLFEIPEGDKTICKLDFQPKMPLEIERLPVVETWKANPKGIKLTGITSVTLDLNDVFVNNLLADSYQTFRRNVHTRSNTITLDEFYESFEKVFHIADEKARIFLLIFIRTGKVKPIHNNQIELLPTAT